jgi:hypothetical protein
LQLLATLQVHLFYQACAFLSLLMIAFHPSRLGMLGKPQSLLAHAKSIIRLSSQPNAIKTTRLDQSIIEIHNRTAQSLPEQTGYIPCFNSRLVNCRVCGQCLGCATTIFIMSKGDVRQRANRNMSLTARNIKCLHRRLDDVVKPEPAQVQFQIPCVMSCSYKRSI